MNHLIRISLLIMALTCGRTASAQFTLSYFSAPDGNGAASPTGQSFTPGDAGSFPTSSAFLTQMTFQTGAGFNGFGYLGTPTFLDVYSDSGLSAYIGSSTTSQTWDSGGDYLTKTWSFDALELDTSTIYYAVFSSDAVSGAIVNRSINIDGNVYSGGVLIYNGSPSAGSDANFSATLATSAIPEPSTYAVFLGIAALGLAAIRRRR